MFYACFIITKVCQVSSCMILLHTFLHKMPVWKSFILQVYLISRFARLKEKNNKSMLSKKIYSFGMVKRNHTKTLLNQQQLPNQRTKLM